MRSSAPIILLILLLSASACKGGREPEKRLIERTLPEEMERSRSRSPDTGAIDVDNKPAPVAPVPEIEPIAAPSAYFGDLKLKRITGPVRSKTTKKNSIVLIIVDALNAKHLSTYGYERETSPNLDKLAEQGVVLSNLVSNSSWTRPSFTSIITGLPKSGHRIEWHGNHLEPKITTLAERFRAAGYRTAAVVGNQLAQGRWGFDQGFQTYEDTKRMNHVFPRDEVLADKAIDWLAKNSKEPFFLMVFFIDPHTPYRPIREHRRFLDELPHGEVTRYPYREYEEPLLKLEHERIIAAYDGEIHSTDKQIGRIVDFLVEKVGLDSVSVVVTADHGEAFGDHNCYTHTYHMWESVLRVPLVLVSGAIEAKGVYDDRPYTHIDIAPTLLDLAGIDRKPGDLPGISLVEALADVSSNRERLVFSQYNAHGVRRQAIRNGGWKLIHHHKVKEIAKKKLLELQIRKPQPDPRSLPSLAWDEERYEFYNIAKDPGETSDLFSVSGKSGELTYLMDALAMRIQKEESPGKPTEEMVKALENIGYIKRTGDAGI